ncbi:MAG: transcriptional regulator [Chitinophagaceae bacterium]|jgi:DNA-binding transcriptional regulator GbsR (MarR family)
MNNQEAKIEFIHTWGILGSQWGINRSMAQIHALLLMTKNAMSTEEIMGELQLSRGNANMNIRDLMNWNLIYKQIKAGDRKEYFIAEHDIWTIATRVVSERKRRELIPAIELLDRIKKDELGGEKDAESVHIKDMVNNLGDFLNKMDKLTEFMLKAEQSLLFKLIVK